MKKLIAYSFLFTMLFVAMPAFAASSPSYRNTSVLNSQRKNIVKNIVVQYKQLQQPMRKLIYIKLPPPPPPPCKNLEVVKGKWGFFQGPGKVVVTIGLKTKDSTCELSYSDSQGTSFKVSGTSLPITAKHAYYDGDNVTIDYDYNQKVLLLTIVPDGWDKKPRVSYSMN